MYPPFSEWERMCKCNMPTNPNAMYVNCDKCQKWFHPQCVGLTEEQVRDSTVFFCDDCKPATTPAPVPSQPSPPEKQ